jgi:hypothetical protein
VPYSTRNCDNDIPGWNWIRFIGMESCLVHVYWSSSKNGSRSFPPNQEPKSPGPGQAHYNKQSPIHLEVPYLSQRDSATDQGLRMCFSSTCAMATAYLKPGCLHGNGQQDDRYLDRVQRHGDSTDPAPRSRPYEAWGSRPNCAPMAASSS